MQDSYHLPYYGAFNWRVANDRSADALAYFQLAAALQWTAYWLPPMKVSWRLASSGTA